jgi:hypothetical protein
MAKNIKKVYRLLAWLLAVVLAAGTFVGCRRTKYGAPSPIESKYGPPPVSGYNNRTKGNVI